MRILPAILIGLLFIGACSIPLLFQPEETCNWEFTGISVDEIGREFEQNYLVREFADGSMTIVRVD